MAICKKCQPKIKLLLKKIDDVLLKNIDKAQTLVSALKNIIDSDSAKIVTDIIPGEWDEELRLKAFTALEVALKSLGFISDLKEGNLKTLIIVLRNSPTFKNALLAKITSKVTEILDGSRHKENFYDLATQVQYSLSK